MTKIQEFLAKAQENAKSKAVDMAKLELSVWDKKHETELSENFGFNQAKLNARKKQLTYIVNG